MGSTLQHDNTPVQFQNIAPVDGKIVFIFGMQSGGFGYMNILKIIEHD